jgi:hypothetical protein
MGSLVFEVQSKRKKEVGQPDEEKSTRQKEEEADIETKFGFLVWVII